MPDTVHVILYVSNQADSRDFYRTVLNTEPRLDVPGMTEFDLSAGLVLGLMPATGMQRLLGEVLPDPTHPVPRCELYLKVADPQAYHDRALAAGARELSSLQPRSWGDNVAYSLDPDWHVLAFATT